MDTFFNTTEINVCQVSSKNKTSWVEIYATIEDWNRLLYNKDEFYLLSKTSVASYYSFMGDASAVIINTRDTLMIHSVISGISVQARDHNLKFLGYNRFDLFVTYVEI